MATQRMLTPMTVALMLAAAVVNSSTFAQDTRPRRGFRFQGPRVNSPEVLPDRRIVFRVFAPKAEAVRLSGTDIPDVGGGLDMKKGADDVWEITIGPIDPGSYRYRFDVDGLSVVDPGNPSTSESNSPRSRPTAARRRSSSAARLAPVRTRSPKS